MRDEVGESVPGVHGDPLPNPAHLERQVWAGLAPGHARRSSGTARRIVPTSPSVTACTSLGGAFVASTKRWPRQGELVSNGLREEAGAGAPCGDTAPLVGGGQSTVLYPQSDS